MGCGRLSPAGRPRLFQGRDDDFPGRKRDLPARDLRQLPGGTRDPTGGLRGAAIADGPCAAGRVTLVRQNPPLAGGCRHDAVAVRVDAGPQQGSAAPRGYSAEQIQTHRHHRGRLHGRGHRLCDGPGRHRRRAGRSRPGIRRQRQGAVPQADHRAGQQGPRHRRRSRRADVAHRRNGGLPCGIAISSSRRCSRIAP